MPAPGPAGGLAHAFGFNTLLLPSHIAHFMPPHASDTLGVVTRHLNAAHTNGTSAPYYAWRNVVAHSPAARLMHFGRWNYDSHIARLLTSETASSPLSPEDPAIANLAMATYIDWWNWRIFGGPWMEDPVAEMGWWISHGGWAIVYLPAVKVGVVATTVVIVGISVAVIIYEAITPPSVPPPPIPLGCQRTGGTVGGAATSCAWSCRVATNEAMEQAQAACRSTRCGGRCPGRCLPAASFTKFHPNDTSLFRCCATVEYRCECTCQQ